MFKKLLFVVLSLMSIIGTANASNIVVLGYHHIVENDVKGDNDYITFKKFEQQMQWLHDNGYISLTVEKLSLWMQDPTSINLRNDIKYVVISFDDGWLNQLSALPVLDKFNYKATFNVMSAVPDHYPGYMNWEQIKMISNKGHEIASHSASHPRKMNQSQYTYEIVASKLIIENKIGKKVSTIAWPHGYYNKDMMQAAISAGYIGAQTIDPHWCIYDGVYLQGLKSCNTQHGNYPFQNPFLIRRVIVDGSCDVGGFKQMVTVGEYVSCINSPHKH